MGKERNCTKSKKIRNSFTKLTYNLLARRWSTKLFIIYNFAAGNYHVRDCNKHYTYLKLETVSTIRVGTRKETEFCIMKSSIYV